MKPGKSQEGNVWVYKGKYNDGELIRWYSFVNLPDGTPIEITLNPQSSDATARNRQ